MAAQLYIPPDKQADNLESAWRNFDPTMPLPGDDHPFYVHRPGEPLRRLATALRLSTGRAPKFFFTGYRGSGKSTELNRLLRDVDLRRSYWIASFSVKERGDIQNLDYTDILLILAGQLYDQFLQAGGNLDSAVVKDLEAWKDRIVERSREKGAVFEASAGAGVRAFFLDAMLKLRTEYSTREQIREVIRPEVGDLIEKVENIAVSIQALQKRQVLVLVDDLDKLNLENARSLFCDNLTALTAPAFTIVYTIPSAILYDDGFIGTSLQDKSPYLSNIRLHPKDNAQEQDAEGYGFFRDFIKKRMQESLIAPAAADALITMSGGVPSAFVLAVQSAIGNALHRNGDQVNLEDAAWGRSQLRNPLLRLLSDDDVAVLRTIHTEHPERLPDPRKYARLVHIQAALQYSNGIDWLDSNPVLAEVLNSD